MIYIKENGVTVEDSTAHEDLHGCLEMSADGGDLIATPESAERLLRGLLRWKLERIGQRETYAASWFDDEYQAWLKERNQ